MVLFIDQLRNKNMNSSMMGPTRKWHRSTTEDHIMRTLNARCRVSATGCSRDVDEKEDVKKLGFGCLGEITLTKKIDYFSFVLLNLLYLLYNFIYFSYNFLN